MSFLLISNPVHCQPGRAIGLNSVLHSDVHQITSLDGLFGQGMSCIGDVDNNGVLDFAIGASIGTNANRGGLYILLFDSLQNIIDTSRIAFGESGFNEPLGSQSDFGEAIEFLGDINGDGSFEIAVGANSYSEKGNNAGAVFILSVNSNLQVINTVVNVVTLIVPLKQAMRGSVRNVEI